MPASLYWFFMENWGQKLIVHRKKQLFPNGAEFGTSFGQIFLTKPPYTTPGER